MRDVKVTVEDGVKMASCVDSEEEALPHMRTACAPSSTCFRSSSIPPHDQDRYSEALPASLPIWSLCKGQGEGSSREGVVKCTKR